MPKRILNQIIIIIIVLISAHGWSDSSSTKGAPEARWIGGYIPGILQHLPQNAQIVYLIDTAGAVPANPAYGGLFHVWVSDGERSTQISLEHPRNYEHAAVSPDRHFIAANEVVPANRGTRSRVWIMDLERQRHYQLVPEFYSAGGGGIDWDHNGYVYFAAQPKPVDPEAPDFVARTMLLQDIYRIRLDGSQLAKLTDATLAGEADVSVSADGQYVAFVRDYYHEQRTEIWMMRSDGSEQRLIYRAGKTRVASAHDPELSDDNQRVTFSVVNAANHNWAHGLNTAHDIYAMQVDGAGLLRLTAPGPISIIPDWRGNLVLYTELSEKDSYQGAALVDLDNRMAQRRLIRGAISAKWIPKAVLSSAQQRHAADGAEHRR